MFPLPGMPIGYPPGSPFYLLLTAPSPPPPTSPISFVLSQIIHKSTHVGHTSAAASNFFPGPYSRIWRLSLFYKSLLLTIFRLFFFREPPLDWAKYTTQAFFVVYGRSSFRCYGHDPSAVADCPSPSNPLLFFPCTRNLQLYDFLWVVCNTRRFFFPLGLWDERFFGLNSGSFIEASLCCGWTMAHSEFSRVFGINPFLDELWPDGVLILFMLPPLRAAFPLDFNSVGWALCDRFVFFFIPPGRSCACVSFFSFHSSRQSLRTQVPSLPGDESRKI